MFTHQEKISILSRHFKEGVSISELARVNQINPVTLYYWKRQMSDKPKEPELPKIRELLSHIHDLQKENKSLKKIVGEQVLDIDCLKDLNEFLKKRALQEQLKKQKSSSKKIKDTPKKG
jgi:transposase-like protein